MAEILHVGIDLGTSRSAISASNGERFVVDSFVGWPAGHGGQESAQARRPHRPRSASRTARCSTFIARSSAACSRKARRRTSRPCASCSSTSSGSSASTARRKSTRERPRGRRRPRRGAAHEQAVPAQLDEGHRRQPADRLRAVRRRVRTRRAAAHDDHRHRRRHDRLLRHEGPLSDRRRPAHAHRSPATRSTRSSSS